MAYCIMRFQKLKAASWGSLAGSLSHTLRSRYTPNADPELIKDNKIWLGPESTKEVVDLVRERWPEKHRKDAVGCIEYFIGASPEWFKKHGGEGDQEQYFRRAIQWLKAEYGEENVVSVVQHNDETSPHLAAYVVPVDPVTGRLNAKLWTGGRAACARMQTKFQEFAGAPVGLERGVRGSNAEHMTIQRWYAAQADLDKREQEIEQKQWKGEADLVAREADLGLREHSVSVSTGELQQREKALAQKAFKMDSEQRKLQEQAGVLADREKRLQEQNKALRAKEKTLAELDRQLAALERELSERGGRLDGGEAALEQRQAEIDRAGAVLQQRLDAARAVQVQFEQQKTLWIAENKPVVSPLVQHLQRLETLSVIEAAEYLEAQDSDQLYELFDALEGLTPQGRALLDQNKTVPQRAEQFEQAFTLSSSAPEPKQGR